MRAAVLTLRSLLCCRSCGVRCPVFPLARLSPLAPGYSSSSVMSSKLLYAISNCQTIDCDATHEGRANLAMTWNEEDDTDE